jgi:predicted nuclease of predicted toxin-antitoxin system
VIRLLLDENVPLASARRLRAAGHDVAQVASGETDRAILACANEEERLVVTYDRDFGYLVFRGGVQPPHGILYFRSEPSHPEALAEQILELLETPSVVLAGKLTVVERTRIRQRPLPRT